MPESSLAVPFEPPELPGVFYQDEFITPSAEAALLHGLHSHPHAWKQLNNRSLQNWGGLPHIKGMLATPLPAFLQPLQAQLVASEIFPAGEAPNHVLANRYEPGQGISPHVDGPAYKPCAAIVSLQAPIVMDFYKAEGLAQPGVAQDATPTASLLLRRRSLIVLRGEVYTGFFHAIAEREEDIIDERVLNCKPEEYGVLRRAERHSLTVRRSCRAIRNPLLSRSRR